LSKYWSEKKSDEKPQSRHQKKEALRVREDYLGATYGWNALERVDPNFTGGATPGHGCTNLAWCGLAAFYHLLVAHHLPPPMVRSRTGTSGAGRWLMPILVFLILSNVIVFLWGNGYIHV
jgi:hypothetical protein